MSLNRNPVGLSRWGWRARLRAALVGLAAAAGLAACGGGTEQYDPFRPDRVIAFGDESSTLTAEGKRYAVNGYVNASDGEGNVVTTPQDCQQNRVWVQSLIEVYGFAFAECNPDGVDASHGLMKARAGATVDDLRAQIDEVADATGIGGHDLATVLVGTHDLLQIYAGFDGSNADDLVSQAGARGRALGNQVNRLVGMGARVMLVNVPDAGVTPFALAEKAAHDDTDRAKLLSRMSSVFNEQLGVTIILDGRYIALVQADLRLQSMVRLPSYYSLTNVTEPACLESAPLPACDTLTLVEDATVTTYLWADNIWPGYPLHRQIALIATQLASNNPF